MKWFNAKNFEKSLNDDTDLKLKLGFDKDILKKPESVEFKPNIKKVLLKNLLKVASIAGSIILFVLYLDFIVGLDTFFIPFEVYEVPVDGHRIILYFILGVVFIAFLTSFLGYISLKGLRYTVYKNKIQIYRSAYMVLLSSKEISYDNIFRVTSFEDGFFNKMFRTGSVVLDLTGLKEKSVKLEFIDKPIKVVDYLQRVIKNYRQYQQARFDEKHRIETLLDQI